MIQLRLVLFNLAHSIARKIPGHRSAMGYNPWCHKESAAAGLAHTRTHFRCHHKALLVTSSLLLTRSCLFLALPLTVYLTGGLFQSSQALLQ